MNTPHNPTASSSSGLGKTLPNDTSTVHRWPRVLVTFAATYYLLSALTLPFVNRFWLGELPVLAIIQLPKSILKSAFHTPLLSAMQSLGYSYGSRSPDYGATHGWAMALMVVLPVLLIIVSLGIIPRVAKRRTLMVAILVCAGIDAVVTIWFDTVSHLKLYNASYF